MGAREGKCLQGRGLTVMPSPKQIPLGTWPARPTGTVPHQLCREGAEHSVVLTYTRGWVSSGPTCPGQLEQGPPTSPAGRPQAEVGSTQRDSFFLLW